MNSLLQIMEYLYVSSLLQSQEHFMRMSQCSQKSNIMTFCRTDWWNIHLNYVIFSWNFSSEWLLRAVHSIVTFRQLKTYWSKSWFCEMTDFSVYLLLFFLHLSYELITSIVPVSMPHEWAITPTCWTTLGDGVSWFAQVESWYTWSMPRL